MKTIFLPTIQHTGTWFCIELLKSQKELSFFSTLVDLESSIINDFRIGAKDKDIGLIQTHFGNGKDVNSPEFKDYVTDKIAEAWINLTYSSCDVYHTIVPVRDPLLSLLTAHIRNPDIRHDYIINGFVTLAEWCKKYSIFIVPVDLYSYKTSMIRYELLRRLFDFIGFTYEPNMAIWAMEWPVYNTIGDKLSQTVKNYYYSRNIPGVLSLIPEDYGYLMSKESVLRPFLENLGYESLLWWS